MAVLRPFIALSLVLIVALTSGAMAVARGQTTSAGSVILCTGTGPVSIAVDANGTPTGPVHICPDCALSLFAHMPVPLAEMVLDLRSAGIPFSGAAETHAPVLLVRGPYARAPPPVV